MPSRSTFHARCVCDAEIVSGTKEGVCRSCGRGFYLDWGNWAEETNAVRIERKLAGMKNEKRARHG